MNLINKIKYRINTINRQGIIIYKPTMISIDRDAQIIVKNEFAFNKQWNQVRQANNKIVGSIVLARNSELEVDRFWIYAGTSIAVHTGAKLNLGTGYINYNSNIQCFKSISIGNDVCISENVTIRDSDNHYIERKGYNVSAPICIGDHVWIGVNATILKGVSIGDGAVVAAGSIVTRDVPPCSMVAGVPAKVIRTNVRWSKDHNEV